MSSFIKSFVRSIEEGLPGESAHRLLMPVNRPFTSDALKNRDISSIRKSAVGVILHPGASSLNCILIQRPDYDGIHSKQIAFPGGKMDPQDPDLEYTARRECHEEINLPHGHGELIGELTEVYIPVSNFIVKPFVLYIDSLPELIPDHREVEQIISFDVTQLIDDNRLKKIDMKFSNGLIQKNIPYFDIEDRIVWGATGMMLAEMREIIKRI